MAQDYPDVPIIVYDENFSECYEILEKRKLYTSFRDLLFCHTRRVS